ncbi:MAG: hypothetical protein QOE61_3388, partial [Micromonosporaceae bacterium]|nr:hypothetical protein [Micromonosporaceae bacterium]
MPLDTDVARFLRESGPQLAFPVEALSDPRLAASYLARARTSLATPAAGACESVPEVYDADAD